MFAKFDVSSSVKQVPYDSFLWPKECDEAIDAFVVSQRWDVDDLSFFCPLSFCFAEKLNPFLILKSDYYFFFKRAGAMRL